MPRQSPQVTPPKSLLSNLKEICPEEIDEEYEDTYINCRTRAFYSLMDCE